MSIKKKQCKNKQRYNKHQNKLKIIFTKSGSVNSWMFKIFMYKQMESK